MTVTTTEESVYKAPAVAAVTPVGQPLIGVVQSPPIYYAQKQL
jgi:hypothetical protein